MGDITFEWADGSKSLTLKGEWITRWQHKVGRIASSIPMPMTDNPTDVEGEAFVIDMGGTKIMITIEFTIPHNSQSDMNALYDSIEEFFMTIPIMEGLYISFPDLNWIKTTDSSGNTVDNRVQCVLQSFSLEWLGGEGWAIHGRMELLAGVLIR